MDFSDSGPETEEPNPGSLSCLPEDWFNGQGAGSQESGTLEAKIKGG